MKNRNSTESGGASVALLFMLCWLWVFILYAGFCGTGSGRDVGISALITLGLLLVGLPGAFICMMNKERLSLFKVAGIIIVGIIICAGYEAYTNHRDKSLLSAARQGDTGRVATLIELGADVNCMLDGSTPIMAAVMEGKKETALLLAERGARLDGVVYLAIKHNHLDMIGTLVPVGKNQQGRFQQVNDALPVAAAAGKWVAVLQLLDRGGNVNVLDSENATLLMMAASHGREDVVQDLLRRGANVTLLDKHSKSAFMYAAERSKKSSIVSTLLRHGADALGRDKEGLTALQLFDRAALFGQWHGVREKEKLQEAHKIREMLKQAEEDQKSRNKP